jgi:ABC-type polysaccharide/polyol phosphate export permease
MQALTSVVSNGALLNKIRLPVSVFPVSMITANVFQFLMGAYPLLAIVALLKSHNLLNVFAILLPFIALVLFCIGVGFFVSALYVFFRDLPYFYELITFMLWISSPVFYPAAIVPPNIQPFLSINPLSPIIESLRQITLSGHAPDFILIVNAILSGTLFAVFGWLYFHRSRSQFMDLL